MKSLSFFCFLFSFFLSLSVTGQTQLTNLPTFYITTTNNVPITSETDYLTGKVTIVSSDSTECMKDSPVEIRGRGNSTWYSMEKKSYRVKFDKKTHLLNLPAKEKDWVFLANYADKTLIRNAVAFEIGKQLGMEYTPPGRFGDVYLNGDFIGNYMITDQLEVTTNRVPAEKQDSTMITLPNISGGYLLDIDGLLDTIADPVYFKTPKGLDVDIKYPKDDEINSTQKTYISDFVKGFETTLFSANYLDATTGYRNLVDTTAIVNWYLACELTGNSDSFWSMYFYKKRNVDKLIIGPLWDYDIAFDNDRRLGDDSQKLMRNIAWDPKTWINQFATDPWFLKKVYARFMEVKASGLLQHLQGFIDQKAIDLNVSQQKNFTRWNILNTIVYQELAARGTYAAEISFLKNYLTIRFAYLETALKNTEPPVFTSIVSPDYFYTITNKLNGKTIDIQDASQLNNAKVVLYSADSTRWSQQWKFVKTNTPNVYNIMNRFSGKVIQNDGFMTSQLFQNTQNAGLSNQQWKVVPINSNYAGIQNTLSNQYVIDNSGGNSSDGNPIIEYAANITGNENQQWGFVKLNQIITGIGSIEQAKTTLTITPNPVEDVVMLTCKGITSDKVKLSVYSCQGVLIYSTIKQVNNSESVNIQLSVKEIGLAKSIYILKMTTENGIELSAKLVVK
jgi:hypothetical protein